MVRQRSRNQLVGGHRVPLGQRNELTLGALLKYGHDMRQPIILLS